MRGTAWAFALCFAALTVLSWRYLFILLIVFLTLITVSLIVAAWLSAKPSSGLKTVDPKAAAARAHRGLACGEGIAPVRRQR